MDVGSLVILVGFFALMYFMLIRPQQKRQKEQQEMMSSLSVGDDVITIGGLHGRILESDEDYVDLEVTDDVVLRYQKSAIAKVVNDEPVDTGPSLDESTGSDA